MRYGYDREGHIIWTKLLNKRVAVQLFRDGVVVHTKKLIPKIDQGPHTPIGASVKGRVATTSTLFSLEAFSAIEHSVRVFEFHGDLKRSQYDDTRES